ncbi:MAG: deaminase [Candidatus Spechtbacterales bacterium]|nr:deaminase [Candidatus Spechtbacterales bacterium]
MEDLTELMTKAYELAKYSKDPSTQNAALLVDDEGKILSKGINKFPKGVTDKPERWERPLKYKIIEHAERNAIYEAAKEGIATEGLVMVCPWAACSDCARAIIQSGIAGLITHKQAHERSPDFWSKEIEVAFEMLDEAGVWVVMCDIKVGVEGLLHSGEIWNP